MANQKHLTILRKGVEVWNQWREGNPDVEPDLAGADLREAELQRAIISDADLAGANLRGANLQGANLQGTDLLSANLAYANLQSTQLISDILSEANLQGANLEGANLEGANLEGATLTGAKLTIAVVGRTTFGDVDLRAVRDLNTVQHEGPSTIGIATIYRSEGNIPEMFLRNTGVPDTFIEYMRSLTVRPIDYYSVFISYASPDQAYAERLHADLQNKGVRCWFAPHDLEIGVPIVRGIDEAIRIYDKLLIIVSEASVQGRWVELEVSTALHRELEQGRTLLFPIRLDDAVLHTPSGWAAQLRTRNIGDFRGWKDHDRYQAAFTRLLRDLKGVLNRLLCYAILPHAYQ